MATKANGRPTAAGTPDIAPLIGEKSMPNYLKPTISSSPDVCRYPRWQKLISNKSLRPVATVKPLALSPRSSNLKEKTPKSSSPSPKCTISSVKSSSNTSSKRAPQVPKTRIHSRGAIGGATRRREANGTIIPSTKTASKATASKKASDNTSDDDKRDGSMHYDASEESICGEEVTSEEGSVVKSRGFGGKYFFEEMNIGCVEARKPKFSIKQQGGIKKENVGLKKQEAKGKETTPAYNEVIEETASKLAAKRNKVKALVGAFETVITLEELKGEEEKTMVDKISQQKEIVKEQSQCKSTNPVSPQKEGEKAKADENYGFGPQDQAKVSNEETVVDGGGLGQHLQSEMHQMEKKKSTDEKVTGQFSQLQEKEKDDKSTEEKIAGQLGQLQEAEKDDKSTDDKSTDEKVVGQLQEEGMNDKLTVEASNATIEVTE